jgi:hypothetical protein
MASWMEGQAADIWLLTEVHRDWDQTLVVSPARGGGPEWKRWAGIASSAELEALPPHGDPRHAGEEGLCLARLNTGGDAASPSILVACSVLPWKGAGPHWPGLPSGGQLAEFRHVLDHHVARIHAERLDGECVIWGGDFNQPLIGPFWGATQTGADDLRSALDKLGVVALTERAEHLNGTTGAIDHLAVSPELTHGEAVASVHRPIRDGKPLSDHAAYTADLWQP